MPRLNQNQFQFCYTGYMLPFTHQVMSNYFVAPWTAARRLLCPWDFPGKNIGVGCPFLLQRIFLIQGSES